MKLHNKQFGEVEFNKENIIKFKNGLLGFEELNEFLLIKTDNDLFFWLSSVTQPELVFPLIGLRLIDDSYPQADDCEAFGIVTLSKNFSETTVNLKAPVYINQNNNEGYQTIVDKDKYSVKYKLFIENEN